MPVHPISIYAHPSDPHLVDYPLQRGSLLSLIPGGVPHPLDLPILFPEGVL